MGHNNLDGRCRELASAAAPMQRVKIAQRYGLNACLVILATTSLLGVDQIGMRSLPALQIA